MVRLQAELTEQMTAAMCPERQSGKSLEKRTQTPTNQESVDTPVADASAHQQLQQRRDGPACRAQVLLMHPDTVLMGLNKKQEDSCGGGGGGGG